MRTVVLSDIERLIIEERPVPQVGPTGALVKVEVCGICGSDLHAYLSGDIFPIGTVMGHECAGTIVEVGEAVKDLGPGDRVAVFGATTCGTCIACRRGLSHHCLHALERAVGCSTELDGGYAEYLWLPYVDEMVFKMPDGLSFEDAALADPVASALRPVRASRFRPGDAVAVLGAGPIGLMAIQLLKLGGAGQIIATEISPHRTAIAHLLGADVVLNPLHEGDELPRRVADLTGGLGVDVVFECSGVPAALQQSFQLVRPRGQIMAVGIIEQATPIPPMDLVFHEIDLQGSMMYSRYEFRLALDLLVQGRIETRLFISDVIPLEEIEERGFKRLMSATDAVKILVRP
jgi:(R,R)-butanediol dehydrogenase/meso-butanediol dehydrogenase/diacetyl reductase